MIETLTLQKAISLAREIVEGHEDYVYEMVAGACVYVHDGQCSCLVGWVLHAHGVSLEELKERNLGSICSRTGPLGDLPFVTKDAAQFLVDLQETQDRSNPWGEALAYALKRSEGKSDAA